MPDIGSITITIPWSTVGLFLVGLAALGILYAGRHGRE